MVKKISIVTGTRAEYGLLTPLIKLIKQDPDLELQLIVTGMHLSPEFGMTIAEIDADGTPISDEIEILLSSDSGYGTAKSVGLATLGFADSYRRLRPDLVVVLGDRSEILAAATVALLIGIPVAHIHGGERTEGAIDESMRHAITKMSRLHFVATDEYARRVKQLGEAPECVFHVGAIGLDRIEKRQLMSKSELAARLCLPDDKPWCAVTYHPVTLERDLNSQHLQQMLNAIRAYPGVCFIFTKANADASGRMINSMIAAAVADSHHMVLFDSLGSSIYLSVMAASKFVMGNSSSGIIEAPFLRIPSIDVGTRQQGRVRCASVVHVAPDCTQIKQAIERCLAKTNVEEFVYNPYYVGGAAQKILDVIKNRQMSPLKVFHDLALS
jgi:GDP/UDP-N,N'-diacetylbacillosamine 2-epimerase (hydrolysing)